MNLTGFKKDGRHIYSMSKQNNSTQTKLPEVWIFSFRKLYLDILDLQIKILSTCNNP